MADVQLEGVSRRFGDVEAVRDVSLKISDGEFLVLIGPSGSGKTTILRMISGLDDPTAGTIRVGGVRVNDIAPKDRNLAMVFQNYALYPHMSVYDNMAFGLRTRKTPNTEIGVRVREAAEMLSIAGLLKRKPKELSGGEKQRVALGRAIVRRPGVFLMDEPLSNLDAPLRAQTRSELMHLHRRLGITTIYVTHDQLEAMSMGQRIAVLNRGEIQQVGTPWETYDSPRNMFTAKFIGVPSINLLPITIGSNGHEVVLIAGGEIFCTARDLVCELPLLNRGQKVVVGVRPENILLSESGGTLSRFWGQVEMTEITGADAHVTVTIGNVSLIARVNSGARPRAGDRVSVTFTKVLVFDPDTGERIPATPSFSERIPAGKQ